MTLWQNDSDRADRPESGQSAMSGAGSRHHSGSDQLEAASTNDKLTDADGKTQIEGQQPPQPDVRELAGFVPGVQIGDFEIVRRIARGGMGVIYSAQQISLDRKVALKVLPLESTTDPVLLQRFKREAQAAASLEHPRIVRAYARGEDHGVYYLAMQFIDGCDLAQFIRTQESENATDDAATTRSLPLPATSLMDANEVPSGSSVAELSDIKLAPAATPDYFHRVARFTLQAAEGIHFAHEHGIIHRDIKPSNLLIDEQDSLWVTDFGLATLERADHLTVTGRLMGTLRYSSPEQLKTPRDIDARTDVYSLGATLYELATLKPAFHSDEPAHLLRRIADEEPRPPRSVRPEIPHDLESVILKAMAKQPGSRYQSALEMAVDLQRFLRNEPVHAKRPTVFERIHRWSQRNRPVYLLSLTVLLLLAVGVVGLMIHSTQQRDLVKKLNESNSMLSENLRENDRLLGKERQLRKRLEVQEERTRLRYNAVDLANIVSLDLAGQSQEVAERLRDFDRRRVAGEKRHFVWRLLHATSPRQELVRNKHQHPVLCFTTNHSRQLVATGDKGGGLIIWDAQDWTIVKQLSFVVELQDLKFSPDDSRLVASGLSGRMQVFDTATWSTLKVMKPHAMSVKSILFANGGKTLITGSRDNQIAFLNTADWTEQRRFEAHDTVQILARSSKGDIFASGGSDGLTKVWSLQNGELISTGDHHKLPVLSLALSDDSSLMASGGYDHFISLSDPQTGQRIIKIPLREQCWCLRFAEDDKTLLACTHRGRIHILDVSDPRQPVLKRIVQIHTDIITDAQVLTDQLLVATVSNDQTMRLTSLKGMQVERHIPSPEVKYAAFNDDGQFIGLGQSNGSFSLLDRAGRPLWTRSVPDVRNPGEQFDVPRVAFTQDSRLRAVIDHRNNIHVATVASDGAENRQVFSHDHDLKEIQLSDHASYVLAVDTRNQGYVWEIEAARRTAELALPERIKSIAISDEHQLILVSTDLGEVFVYALNGKQIRRLVTPAEDRAGLYTVDLSPSGNEVAAAGFSGSIYLWSLASGHITTELLNEDQISFVRFSHDGRYLATASHKLDIWSVDTSQHIKQVGEAPPQTRYEYLSFTSDDDALAAVSGFGRNSVLRIWDTQGVHVSPNLESDRDQLKLACY